MTIYLYDASDSETLSPTELVEKLFLVGGSRVKVENVIVEYLDRDIPALLRPKLSQLASKAYSGHTVVCTELDMLGQNASDILNTINTFGQYNIVINCLQISTSTNLAGKGGELFRKTISAYSALLSRTHGIRISHGQMKMRKLGVTPGRTLEISESNRQLLAVLISHGETVVSIANALGITRSAVYREMKRSNIKSLKHVPSLGPGAGDW